MTAKDIIKIIRADEAIMRGLGKTLVFDIAQRISEMSIYVKIANARMKFIKGQAKLF